MPATPARPLPSALARYADGLVEAAWLTAVACVPLLVNRYAIRAFEPSKLALLKILALIALAAWLLKALEGPGARPEPGRRLAVGWFLWALGGLAVAHLLATLFSVAPIISFWGSYDRSQGTYSVLSHLALCAAMVANLRRREQSDRLVATIVAASIPVAMYGIAQGLGLDPVPSNRAEYAGTSRATSTLGNPVFLAAYLAMVWPLTLGRVLEGTVLSRARGRIVSGGAGTILLILAAAAQLAAIVLTESRGPLLGLVVGTIALLLIIAALRRARRLVLWSTAVVVAGIVLLALAATTGGPLRGLVRIPIVSRLAEVSDPSRGSLGYRVEMWELAPGLLTGRRPVPYPDGSADPWPRLRLLAGFGPETLPALLKPLLPIDPSDPPPDAAPDRFHNDVWDALAATGAVGLAARSGLVLGLLYMGLARLGLVAGRRQRALYWTCAAVGALAGGLIAMSLYHPTASAAGAQLGLVAGLLAYLGLLIFARNGSPPRPVDRRDLLVAGPWAALLGHVVELSFSFIVAETAVLFWAYAALLQRADDAGNDASNTAAAARPLRQRPATRPTVTAPPSWWAPVLGNGAILTAMMITIGFLALRAARASTSILEVLATSLTTPRPGSWASGLLIIGLLGVWAWMAMTLVTSTGPSRSAPARSLAGVLLVSGVLTALYWTWLAVDLAALSRDRLVDASSMLRSAESHAGLVTGYYVCVLVLAASFAAAQLVPRPGRAGLPGPTRRGMVAAPLALGAALGVGWYVALRPIEADTVATRASKMYQARLWEGVARTYGRAIQLAPEVEQYRMQLARLYLGQAQVAATADQREALMAEAEQTWKDAQAVGGLNRGYGPLASFYTMWAVQASAPERRLELARRASTQYARAVVLTPRNSNLWYEWAALELSLLQRPEEGREKALRALDLNPRHESALALLGNYEVGRWRERPATEEGGQALRRAAAYYERAAGAATRKHRYLMAAGAARAELGDVEQAIETYTLARSLASAGEVWEADEALAHLYARKGVRDLAMQRITLALGSAPPEVRARLETFRAQLR